MKLFLQISLVALAAIAGSAYAAEQSNECPDGHCCNTEGDCPTGLCCDDQVEHQERDCDCDHNDCDHDPVDIPR